MATIHTNTNESLWRIVHFILREGSMSAAMKILELTLIYDFTYD